LSHFFDADFDPQLLATTLQGNARQQLAKAVSKTADALY
jgi:hypothetical protein